MKALVLAGGSGSRLRPITHTSAKQLLPVGNKPVLFYGLEAIRAAGITEAGIVVGATAPMIEAAVGDGEAFGLNVSYIHQDKPLGLAHAILVSQDFLGDADFIMYLGDIFMLGGLSRLVEDFRSRRPAAQLLVASVPDPRAFGVPEIDAHGQVVGIVEKPSDPKSNLAVTGVYLLTPVIHDAVAQLSPSWRGEYEISDAVQWLIEKGLLVRSTAFTGPWKDTGSASDLLDANRMVLEGLEPRHRGVIDMATELFGNVVIEDKAQVTGSRIVGPAIIGTGARITGSYIGPFTSVGPDCVIADSEVEHSIVLSGASIRGVGRIEGSVIGRDAEVSPSSGSPRAHRLIVGDDCKVEISA